MRIQLSTLLNAIKVIKIFRIHLDLKSQSIPELISHAKISFFQAKIMAFYELSYSLKKWETLEQIELSCCTNANASVQFFKEKRKKSALNSDLRGSSQSELHTMSYADPPACHFSSLWKQVFLDICFQHTNFKYVLTSLGDI